MLSVLRKSRYNLQEGSVLRPLWGLALPMIIAFGFQTSFNFVDRYFVSKLGDMAIAAIGMAFVVQLVIIAVGAGMGVGLNSFISRSLGAKKAEDAHAAAIHSFIIAVVLGIGLAAVGLAVQEPLFRALGAKGDLLQSIMDYLTIIFLFAPFQLIGMMSNNIFRGWGDTVYPMKFMLLGTFGNIILDPILIFGLGGIPAFGIKGAALATGISRSFALLYTLSILLFKGKPAKLVFSAFRFRWKIISGIFQVGFPASLGQILSSFSLSLIFLILKPFGNDARAAYTIVFTYEMVAFMPVLGIGQAMMIMTGHNYGAQNYKRIRTIFFTSIKLAAAFMLTIGFLVFIAPQLFAGVFAQSKEVLQIASDALRIMAPGYFFNSIFLASVSSFQGLGLGRYQLIATILKMFVITIPLAFAGAYYFALNGIWFGILAANFITAAIMLGWYHQLYHKRLVVGKVSTI